MTDDQQPKVFDMPHARVTLTPIGPGIEIEVWPKAGQSAYAVVDPTVAILIAKRLVEMAAGQLAAVQRAAMVAAVPEEGDEAEEGGVEEVDAAAGTEAIPVAEILPETPLPGDAGAVEEAEEVRPSNVVDLASRRRPSAS